MSTCKKCNNPITDKEIYCKRCGTRTENALPEYKPTNSIGGFILALLGFITCGLTSLFGLILSFIGFHDSRKAGKKDVYAIAGLIISTIPILLVSVTIILTLLFAKDVIVADFSTMSKSKAKKWCKSNEITCNISEEYSSTYESGKLIRQEVEANKKIKSYEVIDLVYSKGEKKKIQKDTTTNSEKESTKSTKKAEQKSSEQIKIDFISSCQSYDYKEIARQPDLYKGKNGKIRGQVVQVSEGLLDSRKITLRVNVTQDEYGFWDDTVLVTYKYKDGENKILEDDIINIYGVIDGTETYISVLGSKVTIPSMTAKYIDIE